MAIATSIAIFILAGLCEIGGGYLVWLWLREQALVDRFGRCGNIGGLRSCGDLASIEFRESLRCLWRHFYCLSGYLGWKVDGIKPDKFDLLGAAIALLGMAIILFTPRK